MNIETIWLKYRDELKGFLHTKVSNPDEVDDLLQEVLIKTFNNIDTINSDSSVKQWLYKTTNNAVVDFYRKQAKMHDIKLDDLWYGEQNCSVQQSLTKCILPLMNALPQETAGLLTAIDIEEKSQKDYAQETGVSYSTLKSRVQKARTELRRLFESCCQFSLDKHGRLADYQAKQDTCEDC